MSTLRSVTSQFQKVLESSGSSSLVKGLLGALTFIQVILPTHWPPQYRPTDGEHVDFIVVGSGSAGAVIATRLSEVPSWTILQVEFGGNPPPNSVIPALFPTLGGTEYDYKYPGHFREGLAQARRNTSYMTYQRGKVLGGCSSVNYHIYSRGKPEDYNIWNRTVPGWSWDDVLPYFKKLENMTDPSVFTKPENAALHSTKGPVAVSRPDENYFNTKISENMLKSYSEMGLPSLLELNGLEIKGVTRVHYTFANGRRSSTAEEYLRPNKDRPNLLVATRARVLKIIIDKNAMRAIGVQIERENGAIVNVYADREVIISGGVFDSPKLLMLSGIGPKEELQKVGIDTIIDLPVGLDMQDHHYVPMRFFGKSGSESAAVNILIPAMWYTFPFSFISGYFSLNISSSQDFSLRPQIQIFTYVIGAGAVPLVQSLCISNGYKKEYCASIAKHNNLKEMVYTTITLLHPVSKGRVTLRSSNPADDPMIETGILSNEEDITALREAVKFMRKLENTTYFSSNNGYLAKPDIPSCDNLQYGTDDYWDCYIRATVGSLEHPVGTCKMGPNGVVDGRLKVHGVEGLRVADASVMVDVPSGNTNIPTMMVGEVTADFIKVDNGVPIIPP